MGVPDAVSASPPRIEVEGLGIRRSGRWVVRGLEWSHGPGGIAWLVGENGAGKSSLLRVLAGRLRPTEGRVGGVPTPAPGAVLYHHPHMRLPRGARLADWDRLLDALPPGGRAGAGLRPPGLAPRRRLEALSTGEERRVQLDALLAREAALVLLDEPYSHLSESAALVLDERLAGMAERATLVVATNRPVPQALAGTVLRLAPEAR